MVRCPYAVDRWLKSKKKLLFHPEWAYAVVGKLKSKKSLLLWVIIFDGVVGVSCPSCIMFHVVLACTLGPNVLWYVTNVASYPWLVKTKLQMFLSRCYTFARMPFIRDINVFCPQYAPTLEGVGQTYIAKLRLMMIRNSLLFVQYCFFDLTVYYYSHEILFTLTLSCPKCFHAWIWFCLWNLVILFTLSHTYMSTIQFHLLLLIQQFQFRFFFLPAG